MRGGERGFKVPRFNPMNQPMNMRNQLEYAVAKGMLELCRILPERSIFALFEGIGLLLYATVGRRRKMALRNLAIAFPEKSPRERKRLARQSFLNLSESLACNALLMNGRISNERLLAMVEVDSEARLRKASALAPKGLLVFSAHLGNWELVPLFSALYTRLNIHVAAREINNPLLEERIVAPLRKRFGVKVFFKKNALMKIMKAMRNGEPAGLMVDQKLSPPAGVWMDFFGRPAPTATSPALLQIRFGVSTMPMFMVRTGRMRYRFEVGEPVAWSDNGKPMEEQVLELTRIHQKLIEDVVRRYPDQWFWVHNRWGLKKGDQ